MARRVLFVTHEMLPFGGGPPSGGGLRVWGLGQGLAARGFEVTYSMPKDYLRHRTDVPPEILDNAYELRHLGTLIRRLAPDVVVLEQPRSLVWYEELEVPVVVDLPGPVFLENQWLAEPTADAILDKVHSLSYGDLFLVSHVRQKSYFLSWLALAGVSAIEERIAVVPGAFPPEGQPERRREAEPLFVYSGFFHPWQNPAPALAVLLQVLERRGTGRLELIGGRHPTDLYGEGKVLDPAALLPASSRLVVREPLPWPELCQELARAWAGVNLLEPNVERENACPIREINQLWCGLPVLVSSQSPLGPEVLEAGAGWVADPTDPAAIERTVEFILDDPWGVDRASEAARALARARYTWDRSVEPLARFCEAPERRKAKGRSFLAAATDREELVKVSRELGQVAEAHAHTQAELARRNECLTLRERELADARAELTARVADLARAGETARELEAGAARLAAEREEALHEVAERDRRAAALAGEVAARDGELAGAKKELAHKDEVLRRVVGDLEQHRRRISQLEGELHHIRRQPLYRAYKKLGPLARPAALGLALGLLVALAWWLAPGLFRGLVRLRAGHPGWFWAGALVAATAGFLVLHRFRRHLPDAIAPKWRWLSPTRARWLGAIKLVFLLGLSLVLMVYLKLWEKIHKVRVFP